MLFESSLYSQIYMASRKNIPGWIIWTIVIIVIVIIIVVFVASLGTINLTGKQDLPKEFADSRKQALIRHDALKRELAKKLSLKQKLDKQFIMIYAAVRIILVGLWIGPLYILYRFGLISEIGDALNYSEATFFVIVIFNFLTFGNMKNLTEFITLLKIRVENWVWEKNLNLKSDIIATTLELESAAVALNTMTAVDNKSEVNTIAE